MPRYNGGFIGTDGLDAPDAPTIGTPSAGSTQADVAFTAGAAGTTATTEFVATTNDGIGATGTSSPITITGLTNGTSYTARVYAKNSHGTSAASEASASFTPLAEVISGLFQCHVYTGNGSSGQSITNNLNLSGKGGLVWLKGRDSTNDHHLFDTERGVTKYIKSSASSVEATDADTLTAFNSNGFSLGADTDTNADGNEYVSWSFRKTPKFFDIVTYTGTGSATTISHSLGSVPGSIWVKCTSDSNNWAIYHRGVDSSAPEDYKLDLGTTDARTDNSSYWNDTAPTSSVFTVGTSGDTNANGETYLAYIFAHNNSDGGFGPDSEDIIKCGSYTGAYPSNVTVDLGFEPQFILVKNATSSSNWGLFDVIRGMPLGDCTTLAADTSTAENGVLGSGEAFEATATGFIVDSGLTAVNDNGSRIIYIAIRRPDMSTPTAASEVFSIDTQGSSAPYFDSTHIVDMALVRPTGSGGSGGGGAFNYARLMDQKYLKTSSTAAEANASEAGFDFMNGHIDQNWGGTNTYSWMWKRAKGYFDVVAYSGTGSATTINHGLGVVPEMMWVKARSHAVNWAVYHKDLSAGQYLRLNSSNAVDTNSAYFTTTAPTSSVFSIGVGEYTNQSSSHTYIAYLFATVAGVSKVGSFTQSGATNVACGFSGDTPSFILLKRTDGSGNWYLFDSSRGIVAGNDPHVYLDTNDAEITNADLVDPYSGGFATTSSLTNGSYIFYAIAATS